MRPFQSPSFCWPRNKQGLILLGSTVAVTRIPFESPTFCWPSIDGTCSVLDVCLVLVVATADTPGAPSRIERCDILAKTHLNTRAGAGIILMRPIIIAKAKEV